jgi:hypothetical protein
MAEEPKKIKPTTKEDRLNIEDNILKNLHNEKVMKIPDEQIVMLPISGAFKRNIDEILFYIMDDMDAGEIIQAFQMIRENFKGYEPEQISPRVRCLWTLTTITTELNFQAAQQDVWVESDKTIGDSFDSLVQTDAKEANLSEYKQDRDAYKAVEQERLKNLNIKIKKEKAKQAAEKKKKSNED